MLVLVLKTQKVLGWFTIHQEEIYVASNVAASWLIEFLEVFDQNRFGTLDASAHKEEKFPCVN